MQSLYEILKASKTGIAPDMYTALYSKAIAGGTSVAEYTGPVPVTITADGNNATVGLQGNMTQTGTPTPENPITPQETGDRTENLWDGISYNAYITVTGEYVSPDNTTLLIIFKCEPNTTYTIKSLSPHGLSSRWRIAVFAQLPTNGSIGTIIVNDDSLDQSTITTLTDSKYVVVYYKYSTSPSPNTFMLNTGSTALPYEPYGYKIPISSANTTTPVYLGEVQSTRQIKKLVLTGEETAYAYEYSGNNGYSIRDVLDTSYPRAEGYCSHYVVSTATPSAGTTQVLWIGASNAHLYFVGIADIIGTTSANEFKQWLAQQYANGTPVTVWYVLATPTTGIVNEPLRKIGEYADTVSGLSIPTVKGSQTFDVETSLKPSEVRIEYHKP